MTRAGYLRRGAWGLMLGAFLCSCGQVKQLSRADSFHPSEQLEYLVLASISPEHGREYLLKGSSPARQEYADWFWHNSGWFSGPDTASARAEYLDRARRAREFFGSVDLMNDERVRAYIRFGTPRRESYQPEPVRDETLTIIVNPAEIWTYHELGYQFDFVKTGTAYRLVGETRFGPSYTAPAFEPVDLGRPMPEPAAEARQLSLALSLPRFEHRNDTVETELHYGIPMRELAGLTTGALPLVWFGITLEPQRSGSPVSRSVWSTPNLDPDTADTRLAVAREVLRLPADIYRVTVQARSADGSALGAETRELNLVDYVRRVQPASDFAFYSVADSSAQGPQFMRGSWLRLVPLVTPEVTSGNSIYAMYEIYNTGTDQDGRHHIKVDYQIVEELTRLLAVVPRPTRFISDYGPRATVVERIHTMDLRPGRYLLIARVRDMLEDRDVSLTARFRILPRR